MKFAILIYLLCNYYLFCDHSSIFFFCVPSKISFSCTTFAISRTHLFVRGCEHNTIHIYLSFFNNNLMTLCRKNKMHFQHVTLSIVEHQDQFYLSHTCTLSKKFIHTFFFRSASFGIFIWQHDEEENRISSHFTAKISRYQYFFY